MRQTPKWFTGLVSRTGRQSGTAGLISGTRRQSGGANLISQTRQRSGGVSLDDSELENRKSEKFQKLNKITQHKYK